jgi:hypothetical protein
MLKRMLVFLIMLLIMFLSMSNVPAPWFPCEDKNVGDPCVYGYGCNNNGTCLIQEECEDSPETEVNECLQCDTSAR